MGLWVGSRKKEHETTRSESQYLMHLVVIIAGEVHFATKSCTIRAQNGRKNLSNGHKNHQTGANWKSWIFLVCAAKSLQYDSATP